jgi:hypothetical protein
MTCISNFVCLLYWTSMSNICCSLEWIMFSRLSWMMKRPPIFKIVFSLSLLGCLELWVLRLVLFHENNCLHYNFCCCLFLNICIILLLLLMYTLWCHILVLVIGIYVNYPTWVKFKSFMLIEKFDLTEIRVWMMWAHKFKYQNSNIFSSVGRINFWLNLFPIRSFPSYGHSEVGSW